MRCPDPGTHERILDSAEKLFADNGFRGTSLRQITQAAKVNIAAVNYHFGTKEALYVEVIRRRIDPINEARLARLEEAIANAPNQLPGLEQVMDILIRPIFEVHRDPARGGPAIVRIIARTLTEPLPFMSELIHLRFRGVLTRFGQVVRRHVPHLTPEEFLWRLSFVVGAMQHTLATLHQMGPLTNGICRSNDYEGALRRFITSAIAVFTTPSAPRAA